MWERGGSDKREGLCGVADRLRGPPPEEEGEDAQEGAQGIQGGECLITRRRRGRKGGRRGQQQKSG